MKGKAIIFSAPSGAGKTTLVKHLLQKIPSLKFSISATTRSKRFNETEGVDYYFLSKETFQDKIDKGEILEWEEVYPGSFYGTLKEEVERIWASGNHVIFDVEVIGGMNLKNIFGNNALAVFVKVEDISILKNRLKRRETESQASLDDRIERAKMEMNEEGKFDVVIVNHNLESARKQAENLVKNFLDL